MRENNENLVSFTLTSFDWLSSSDTSAFQWIILDWNGFSMTSKNEFAYGTSEQQQQQRLTKRKPRRSESEMDAFENWIISSKIVSLLQTPVEI